MFDKLEQIMFITLFIFILLSLLPDKRSALERRLDKLIDKLTYIFK